MSRPVPARACFTCCCTCCIGRDHVDSGLRRHATQGNTPWKRLCKPVFMEPDLKKYQIREAGRQDMLTASCNQETVGIISRLMRRLTEECHLRVVKSNTVRYILPLSYPSAAIVVQQQFVSWARRRVVGDIRTRLSFAARMIRALERRRRRRHTDHTKPGFELCSDR